MLDSLLKQEKIVELIKNNDSSVRPFHPCFLGKIIEICFKIGVDKHLGLYGRKLKPDDEPYLSEYRANDALQNPSVPSSIQIRLDRAMRMKFCWPKLIVKVHLT